MNCVYCQQELEGCQIGLGRCDRCEDAKVMIAGQISPRLLDITIDMLDRINDGVTVIVDEDDFSLQVNSFASAITRAVMAPEKAAP
jgi:hypothetical protein